MSSADVPEDHGAVAPDGDVPAETAEDLYEHAPCGYLSTLPDGTIVKINETLLSWLGYRLDDVVGRKRFAELLGVGGRIYHETHYAPLLFMQGHVREIALEIVCADGARLPVLVNSVVVRRPDGSPQGIRTIVLDATHRREYERELLRARERAEQSEARAKVLAQTLQASLIPPTPPAIPGLDVGTAYRPAGTGDEVGGDFYDVFETGDGDWAVVLGDVCGKGAEAAVVTALARYTIRAAAMRTRRPSAVLTDLNEALLRHAGDRFCTVLYLRVRPDPSGRAEVTISSGGHALPLRVSGDAVTPVGTAGSLLGVMDDVTLHDATVVLDRGEVLFCCTDGLAEGRRGDEFFGDARLQDALTAMRGRPASEVAPAVVQQVVDFQAGIPRDDMAAVAIGVPAVS